ncbi:hypothetical protein [Streptomyces jumonjinensis]|uniref:Uncharacterized protein n=1 Tax=Streptomyces jumonjinensis TaxID=1945 RepID=A0A646KUU5_STRJU|nr:hypothetical protein [Streptomyces jumonjinensis]MQT04766.1 hypothetical protein [Streptomyces jumonjinensis]
MRSPAPAAPPQRGIIEEYLHENGLAYPTYGGPYEGWIRPTEVSRVPTGEHFQAVRVPYESAMRTLTAHPGLAHGPVVVNDYPRVVTFLIPRSTRPGHWNVPGTRFLRPGVIVEIPPAVAVRCRDIHWLTPPGTHRDYTVADLVAALTGSPASIPMPARPRARTPRSPRRRAA